MEGIKATDPVVVLDTNESGCVLHADVHNDNYTVFLISGTRKLSRKEIEIDYVLKMSLI
jgi:hypothetical protein